MSNMSRRLWSVIISIFLLFPVLSPTTFVSGSKAEIYGGRILHVGGTGPGNYSKISDALAHAKSGDIILIHMDSSPYRECISIEWKKSITLLGEDPNVTIEGTGNESLYSNICMKIERTRGIKIHNLSFKGGFMIRNSPNLTMSRCSFFRPPSKRTCFDFYFSPYCLLEEVNFYNVDVHFIECNHTKVKRCGFSGIGRVNVGWTDHMIIEKNIFNCTINLVEDSPALLALLRHPLLAKKSILLSPWICRSLILLASLYEFAAKSHMERFASILDHLIKGYPSEYLNEFLFPIVCGAGAITVLDCTNISIIHNRIHGSFIAIGIWRSLSTRVEKNLISNNFIGISVHEEPLWFFPPEKNLTLVNQLKFRNYLSKNANLIVRNNFRENTINAILFRLGMLGYTKWRGNYWDRPRVSPYPIPSFLTWVSISLWDAGCFPQVPIASLLPQFDPFPAKLPYRIESGLSKNST